MSHFWKKNIIVFIIYLLVFASLTVLFLMPTIKNIKDNKKMLAEKQLEFCQVSDEVSTLQKTKKDNSEVKTMFDTVNGYWPDNQDISQFMVQTEGLANKLNIVIENFAITQPATKDKKSNSIQFNFTAKAPYPTVIELLRNMESLARFNTISSINLNLDNDGRVSASVIGYIYYGK